MHDGSYSVPTVIVAQCQDRNDFRCWPFSTFRYGAAVRQLSGVSRRRSRTAAGFSAIEGLSSIDAAVADWRRIPEAELPGWLAIQSLYKCHPQRHAVSGAQINLADWLDLLAARVEARRATRGQTWLTTPC